MILFFWATHHGEPTPWKLGDVLSLATSWAQAEMWDKLIRHGVVCVCASTIIFPREISTVTTAEHGEIRDWRGQELTSSFSSRCRSHSCSYMRRPTWVLSSVEMICSCVSLFSMMLYSSIRHKIWAWRNRIECLYLSRIGEMCINTATYRAKRRKMYANS